MRIGLFSDTYLPELNGVASSVGILKNALESIGHEVYVITTKPDGYDISQDDANVIRLNGIELKSLYGYVLTSPLHFSAYEMVKSKQLDVIHAHTEFGVGIFARICASMLKIPLVSTYHTTYEDYTHYLNPVGLDGVEKVAKVAVSKLSKLYGDSSVEVIAPSEKTKAMLLRYNIRSSIHVIPTGLPLERFKSENTSAERVKELRDQYGVKDNEFLITYLGRVAKEKNIGFVIDGFSKIKEKQLPCKLLIVGGGPDEEDLHKQVQDLGLSDYVSFAGRQPREDVPSFYHASNAFISASTSETQGMTYIEALASGLPVFAYKDPVLDEIIVENESGYFFTSEEEMI
ncbi:MAG: glycosyltransferase, partial [Erysipelotrichaceae bacterium]|nr:glycosyltransferase [Erysipelotrichaceae bacterium]